jgi:hypothetical protein
MDTLEFLACALGIFLALMSLACYITTWATPRDETDPEIPKKSGYLAEIDKIDTERL